MPRPKTFDEICSDAAWLADNARPMMEEIKRAMKPFANLVRTTEGRIPVERLSLENWHNLLKIYTKIEKL